MSEEKVIPEKLKWLLGILAEADQPILPGTKDMRKTCHWAWTLKLAERRMMPGEPKFWYSITDKGREAHKSGFTSPPNYRWAEANDD